MNNRTDMEQNYSKRETDAWRSDITETLDRIETQTTRTNGRVTKLERIVLVMATVLIVLLAVSNPSLAHLLSFIPGL